MLSVRNLSINFGGVRALNDVSLLIEPGSIHGLIGPNGAGKTTLINCISRFYNPTSGSVEYLGNNLLRHSAHQLPAIGIRRTFQDVKVNPDLTVMENLLVGMHTGQHGHFLAALFRTNSARKYESEMIKRARKVLRFMRDIRESSEGTQENLGYPALHGKGGFPDLIDLEDYPASMLPFAARKSLDLARALVSQPKLLLLDEPAAGIQHTNLDQLADLIQRIRTDLGMTILLVEHHMSLVMKVCDRISVLDFGQKISEGTPAEIQKDEKVIKAYLGKQDSKRVIRDKEPDQTSDLTFDKISEPPLLELKQVDVYFGTIRAVSNVNLTVPQGEITCLIGGNGAGKSTLLKSISGLVPINEGSIIYKGEVIADRAVKLKPHQAVRNGISQVLEGRQLFQEMSVRANLRAGALTNTKNFKNNFEKVLTYFPALRKKLDLQAASLSGGEQQMLAISQALLAEPEILLLDEPSLGLAPTIVDQIFEIITQINKNEGTTILLVEQNAHLALSVSDHAYIMETGRFVASGTPEKLLQTNALAKSYLGLSG